MLWLWPATWVGAILELSCSLNGWRFFVAGHSRPEHGWKTAPDGHAAKRVVADQLYRFCQVRGIFRHSYFVLGFVSFVKVLDPPQGDEAGPASRGAFGIHAGAELATEGHRLWSALAETSHATASRFSRLVRPTAGPLLAPTQATTLYTWWCRLFPLLAPRPALH